MKSAICESLSPADTARWLARLADDQLILGHRLSEWVGHAPMLEEELALGNLALDLIGQARSLYAMAAEAEGKGRTEDDFAFLRPERQFQNLLLVERPNGDFAHTMLRQFFFAAFMLPYWQAAKASTHAGVAAVAAKAEKELAYHLRHSGEWVIRLADGTEESRARIEAAYSALLPYIEEMFEVDALTQAAIAAGVSPDPAALRPAFEHLVRQVFAEAGLHLTRHPAPQTGGRAGRHTEFMGHLLAEMQYMQRSYPGATW